MVCGSNNTEDTGDLERRDASEAVGCPGVDNAAEETTSLRESIASAYYLSCVFISKLTTGGKVEIRVEDRLALGKLALFRVQLRYRTYGEKIKKDIRCREGKFPKSRTSLTKVVAITEELYL